MWAIGLARKGLLLEHCGNYCLVGRAYSLAASLATLSGGRASALGEGRGLRLLRVCVGVEMAVALATGLLGILTIFWHGWIEI
jgi:hypothetical protein